MTTTNLQHLKSLGADRPPMLRNMTALWAGWTIMHVTIWAMICAISAHVDQPWFLWAVVPPGIALGAAHWLNAPRQ